MHQRHLDTVARLGFNPGLRQPAFPEFKPLVEVIPEILTLNEDGTTALFVDVPRAESRLTEAPNASSKLSHDAKPRTSPPSAKPAPARQMQLALGLADSPSEKVAATVSTSGPNSIPDAFPVRHSQPSPTDLTTLRHIHLPAGNSESTFAKEKFAPAEIQLSLGINPDGPSPSLRPTGSVVQQYPAPRPATKAVDGPRLGPWLSRGGAAASPFVRSFA
jgi:hypothetical protein